MVVLSQPHHFKPFLQLPLLVAFAACCVAIKPLGEWMRVKTKDAREVELIKNGPRLGFNGIKSGNIQRGMAHSVRDHFGTEMPPVVQAVTGFRKSNEIPYTHFRAKVWDRNIKTKTWDEVPGTGPDGTHVIPLPHNRDFTTPEGALFTSQEVARSYATVPDTKKPTLPTWIHLNKLDQHGDVVGEVIAGPPRLRTGGIKSKSKPSMWHGYEGELAQTHRNHFPPITRTGVGSRLPHVREIARQTRLNRTTSKHRSGSTMGPFLGVAHRKLHNREKVEEAAWSQNRAGAPSQRSPARQQEDPIGAVHRNQGAGFPLQSDATPALSESRAGP
ncbi:hypothetical protein CBOM_06231 [Ceraceosorus bombacis]|uniref:Uncharacterized protein n=1 Tax=Ceraceosorus bombacis TaxID=401625 RepID=A0A0P1BJP1_9BASI|nr:hypothetical protein CBOM_06231 [Ceraceosorus bombacis]